MKTKITIDIETKEIIERGINIIKFDLIHDINNCSNKDINNLSLEDIVINITDSSSIRLGTVPNKWLDYILMQEYIKENNKIAMIRLFRGITQIGDDIIGLRESKNYIDNLIADNTRHESFIGHIC
jgi:hypothetical protein